MKIIVLGNDGYIGYPLTIHLLNRGHRVMGVDNFSRRKRVYDIGSDSLTPILDKKSRVKYLKEKWPDSFVAQVYVDLGTNHPGYIESILSSFKPDAIVHLAEMPSAPWSMTNAHRASVTQLENVIGTLHLLWAIKETCPECHLIKLGTMGEYGTPDCDIPEGRIPEGCIPASVGSITERSICPMRGLLFPRTPGSFYHLSKVHDTLNIEFACRNWRLRSTDIMQGVVFGLNECESPIEMTRFDYDDFFGTAINRFCAQAINEIPLTVYGIGEQTRGFLPLKDSIQCLTIALENPPAYGEYRTLNQFENIYTINSLAQKVVDGAAKLGLICDIKHIVNPREEAEEHYYNPDHQKLFDLGYVPTKDIDWEIYRLMEQLYPYAGRVNSDVINPRVSWE